MRFVLSFMLLLTLTACGFTPVYKDDGSQNSVTAELNQIDIAIIPNREGQFLRNELIDRFYQTGYPAAPQYKLTVSQINETITNFDITVDSEATRQQIRLRTLMTLTDLNTNQNVLTRTLIATTSNNVLESEFSTIVTEQSAREAALNDLARQIEQQLTLFFSSGA